MTTQESAVTRWMSVKEVSEYLGVKPSTLYAYVSERRIPYHKIPGSQLVKFKASEIDDWMGTGRVETKEEYLDRLKG
jgi:excisionase family DNA binding protein